MNSFTPTIISCLESILACFSVADLSKLNEWTKNKFKDEKNCGLICLKGGDLNEELIPFKNRAKIYNISDFYKEDFFLSKKIIFLPAKN